MLFLETKKPEPFDLKKINDLNLSDNFGTFLGLRTAGAHDARHATQARNA